MAKLLGVIAGLAGVGLWLLSVGIYLLTLYIAYRTGFVAMLLTLIFPVVGQLVWLWVVWGWTEMFFNPYTILCLSWIALAAIVFGFAAMADRKRST